MRPSEALREGIRLANSRWRLAAVLLLLNLMVALLLSAPVYSLLESEMSDRPEAWRTLERFDAQWYGEFVYRYPELEETFKPVLGPLAALVADSPPQRLSETFEGWSLVWFALAALVYLAANAFFNAGAIGALARREPFSWQRFWADGGRFGFQLFKLMLLFLPLYLLLLGVNQALWRGAEWLVQSAASERTVIAVYWLRLAVVLALFCFINMASDYAKIKAVVEQSGTAVGETRGGFGFVLANLKPAALLYLLVALIGAGFFLLYLLIEARLPQNSALLIMLVFLLRQALILARAWTRILFFSSQLRFYQAQSEAAIAAAS